jgi:hypothetical protein
MMAQWCWSDFVWPRLHRSLSLKKTQGKEGKKERKRRKEKEGKKEGRKEIDR